MGLGRTRTTSLVGVQGHVVDVEADVSSGLPQFVVSGMPDTACAQAPSRVRAASANSGCPVPLQRVTVNLSPASIPKSGASLDLAIAVAVAAAGGGFARDADQVVHLGELSLDGSVRPVAGVLPAVMAAVAAGFEHVVVPAANAREARLVPGATVHAVSTLAQLLAHYRGDEPLSDDDACATAVLDQPRVPDLADIVGQEEARLGLELAAAGRHHMFLLGPPGAGKTMLAERLPGILPELQAQESLEVSAIHSVRGRLQDGGLLTTPPFVAPHHGASMAAVVGGGSGRVLPGEVSLAHRGVLFLDEAPEFRRDVLDALRQPVESGEVVLARARATVRYPARFQLVLAANPCPCGRATGKGLDCVCTPMARRTYLTKLSGPLMDRVDIRLDIPRIAYAATHAEPGESTKVVAQRVAQARAAQAQRWSSQEWSVNAEVPGPVLRRTPFRLPGAVTRELDRALEVGRLTLRGYDRSLRVAWTAADLRGAGTPDASDVGLALAMRESQAVAA